MTTIPSGAGMACLADIAAQLASSADAWAAPLRRRPCVVAFEAGNRPLQALWEIVSAIDPLPDSDFARWDLAWVLLAVPLVVSAFVWGMRRRAIALERLGNRPLVDKLTSNVHHGNRALSAIAVCLATLCCALGLMRLQYGGTTETVPAPGLDIVLVVDYSKSMLARDIYPSRNERLEAELSRFLDDVDRRGDRVGLVVFAGAARGLPLTRDTRLLRVFLQRADPRTENPGGTAIGKALALAVQLLAEARVADAGGSRAEALQAAEQGDAAVAAPSAELADQVIVLLTDGEDTKSRPREIAEQAAKLGIRIYTVGIGSKLGEPVQAFDADGNPTGFALGPDGKPVITRLDEALLSELAKSTGGQYVHLSPDRFGLDEVRASMAELRTAQREELIQIHRQEGFAFHILPALLLLSLSLALGERRRPVA